MADGQDVQRRSGANKSERTQTTKRFGRTRFIKSFNIQKTTRKRIVQPIVCNIHSDRWLRNSLLHVFGRWREILGDSNGRSKVDTIVRAVNKYNVCVFCCCELWSVGGILKDWLPIDRIEVIRVNVKKRMNSNEWMNEWRNKRLPVSWAMVVVVVVVSWPTSVEKKERECGRSKKKMDDVWVTDGLRSFWRKVSRAHS